MKDPINYLVEEIWNNILSWFILYGMINEYLVFTINLYNEYINLVMILIILTDDF